MTSSRAEVERDLYLRLLELTHSPQLEDVLRGALRLAIEATGSAGGHIHIFGETGEDPEWSMALGRTDADGAEVRKHTSRGIEAQVMATGRVVQTPSALLDPSFKDRESVRVLRVEAVLCAPIGGATAEGVLYLHGQSRAGPFLDDDLRLVETFTRHLGPLVRLLVIQQRRNREDPTLELRRQLSVDGVAGTSEAVRRVLESIKLTAAVDVPVLITGETGTGKTIIAQSIHANSHRRNQSFVELNCAAVVETLFESELFGSARGAFTNAEHDRPGKITAAEGGTLFLDEIGELSPQNQAKLLQFVQSGRYYRVGEDQPRVADVRIIAATNKNLEAESEAGGFRQELYHRLNVYPFRVPSIEERREDILTLAKHFVETAARRYRRPALPISAGAQVALATMPLPGNVRSLENAMTRALLRATDVGSAQIEAAHVVEIKDGDRDGARPKTYQEAMHECQGRIVKAALEANQWNVLATAKQLDITRAHLYNLIKLHGLSRK